MGELIAVLSGKGGTGKTSVCAGLATALASLGESVLCIDCDIGLRNLDIALGLADAKDVEKTEQQLQKAIPQSDWSLAHHWIIFHGRRVCSARAPKCETCTLQAFCKYYQSAKQAE